MIERSQVVLEHIKTSDTGPLIAFFPRVDEPRPEGSFLESYWMSQQKFEDFGSPAIITITIEPGNIRDSEEPADEPESADS
jgi:hypothetical protein